MSLISNSAAGTVAVTSAVTASSGGTKCTGSASEKSAFPTVSPHTASLAGATASNPECSFHAPELTTVGVPNLVVPIGGITGSSPAST